MANEHLTSAFGLVRLQFEALVRGIWLQWAATDDDVEHMHRDIEHAQTERLAMTAQMLKDLQGKAPNGVLSTLEDFRTKSLKPLNSFVHSGAHAYQRSLGGYPERLVRQVLVASNGLQAVAAFQIISLAHEQNAIVRWYGIQTLYQDCLPERAA